MCTRKKPTLIDQINEVGEDGRPQTLLRYTKEKIDADVINVSIWEHIEIFIGGHFNFFISKTKLLIVAGSCFGYVMAFMYAMQIGELSKPEDLIPRYHDSIAAISI